MPSQELAGCAGRNLYMAHSCIDEHMAAIETRTRQFAERYQFRALVNEADTLEEQEKQKRDIVLAQLKLGMFAALVRACVCACEYGYYGMHAVVVCAS